MRYSSKFMEWTRFIFGKRLTLFDLTPQGAFLGFLNVNSKPFLIQNHLLLIFKIYIYNSRRSQSLIIKYLIREIMKVKNIEKKVSINNEKKTYYVQEKKAASWKYFENQILSIFYLIWFSLWVGVGGIGIGGLGGGGGGRIKTGEKAKGDGFQ